MRFSSEAYDKVYPRPEPKKVVESAVENFKEAEVEVEVEEIETEVEEIETKEEVETKEVEETA